MDFSATVDKTIATAVDNIVAWSLTDDEHEVHLHVGVTRSNDDNSPCSSAKDNVDIQFTTQTTTFEHLLADDVSQDTTPCAAATRSQ